jgi:hypothetical protein
VDLEMGRDVFGDDLGGEAPGSLLIAPVDDMAVHDQGARSGRPRSGCSEMAASNQARARRGW